MTHSFYGDDEPGLINAVLDAITRAVRPGDLDPRTAGKGGERRGKQ